MHSNGEIIKRAYDAFGLGDMPTVFGILDKEIKWQWRGSLAARGTRAAADDAGD